MKKAKPGFLCHFHGCSEAGGIIILTDNATGRVIRPRFCGRAHAVAWLIHRIEQDGALKTDIEKLKLAGIGWARKRPPSNESV
jgi:hypothetical protein